ncbi:urease accessory protein UreD [Brevibacterium sp. UCMA 11754]|uniref:urease accessory protein UreD n=1 Tax=Brevibacterium sp. UCMA 11754 TaxID=2749198 RepID=UPI001F3267F4|nr:urease accessory protein UreD [Brevibacterium sp. UCMA 11754]MCF2570958.1 urease accessory protein UreD [Brevibacterium sp. UCMA 11754]
MFDYSHPENRSPGTSSAEVKANGPSGMTCRASVATEAPWRRPPPAEHACRACAPSPTGAATHRRQRHEPYIDRDPNAARIALTSGAAGPLGGDHYRFDVSVGDGSSLLIREVSATLVLPGVHGHPSLLESHAHVGEAATLVWVPEPVIAANGCRHTHTVDIDLAADARLFYREELVLGRHGEDPGDLSSALTVRRGGAPLSIQRFDLGPNSLGFDSPAVAGRGQGVGSIVIVDPEGGLPAETVVIDPQTAILPVDDTCVQITAVGADALALRKRLDAALTHIGEPWGREPVWSAVPR